MKSALQEIKCFLMRPLFFKGKTLTDFSTTLEYSFSWEDFIISSGLAYYIFKKLCK